MSLEWARARLLEHREALRLLCESGSAAPAPPARAATPHSATVVQLHAAAGPPAAPEPSGATVIKFVPRRRRA